MRTSSKTEQELCLHMASLYQIERDIGKLYWSYGTLHPTHRIEWWVILDSECNYRFYEFTVDHSTREIKCTQTFASNKTREVERLMKKHSRMAYILYMIQTK